MDSDLESSGNEYFPSDTSGSSEEEDTITFSDADLLLGPGDDDRDAESFCGDVDNGMDFLHKDDGDDDMDVELLRNDDGLSDIFWGMMMGKIMKIMFHIPIMKELLKVLILMIQWFTLLSKRNRHQNCPLK